MDEVAYTKKQLEDEEGRVKYAYRDSLGLWTIGIGFLIDKLGGGLDDEEIDWILQHRYEKKKAELNKRFPWMLQKLDPVRYAAVLNMCYQLGLDGFSKFLQMISALKAQNWEAAAKEGLNSKWAQQTPERAKRMTDQIKTGEWQWK